MSYEDELRAIVARDGPCNGGCGCQTEDDADATECACTCHHPASPDYRALPA
jgi:hypothetical protein